MISDGEPVWVVQFSTGAGSAEVAYRIKETRPNHRMVLMSADTLVEDDDNWRFAEEVWSDLGEPEWIKCVDGRTPMEVGRDERCVPNNRMAVCSKFLKRKILRKKIEEMFDPRNAIICLGFDWTEEHRFRQAEPSWEPWVLDAPLMRPPYFTKSDILDRMRSRGIEPPRLYADGFSHANCGGACVRGGQAQWNLLLQTNRPRFLEWEAQEEESRVYLGKDVAILRDRRGGPVKPYPLRQFRLDRERGSEFEEDEWGACGCFMDEE